MIKPIPLIASPLQVSGGATMEKLEQFGRMTTAGIIRMNRRHIPGRDGFSTELRARS